ncbi:MAG: hypothetical protein ABI237_05815 [Ginsengibacter sp.]
MITGVLFCILWLFLIYQTIKDNSLLDTLLIVTAVLAVLFVFGLWSVPIYKKKTALPLEKDLESNFKLQLSGKVVGIKWINKYSNKLVFRQAGSVSDEDFFLNCGTYDAGRKFHDVFIKDRDIVIEYLPNTKVVIGAYLSIPLTIDETLERKKQSGINTLGIILAVLLIVILVALYPTG